MRKNGKLFKRLLVLFLVLVLCLQAEFFPMQALAEENSNVVFEEVGNLSSAITVGDINGDGHVNILDLQLLLRHISRRNLLTEELQLRASDINQDGRVDILDLRMLLQYVSRRISNLPAENTPDSSFINPGEIGTIYGNGVINRVQWSMLLTDAAYLDVATDYVRQMSSFADIDRNNPWFMDLFPDYNGEVEVVLQNNVIVASAQNEYQFYPTLSATKSFAVVTAVRALGFYREEEHNLQDIFAIARDIGLVTGTPTSDNLTENQANAILDVVRGIARPLDYGAPIVEIDFIEGLVWLEEDEEVVLDYHFNYADGTGSVHLEFGVGDVAVGDILILPPCDIYLGGFGQKVTGVYQQSDGTVIVSTEMPELEDLLAEDGRLYVSGSFEGKLDNFVLNPNLQEELGNEWTIVDELAEGFGRSIVPASSSSFELRVDQGHGSGGRGNLVVEVSARDGSDSLICTFTVYVPTVNASVDIRRGLLGAPAGVNQFRLEVENRVNASVTGSTSLISKTGSSAIRLGTFPIPLGAGLTGNVGLFLEFSASGSINITYSLESVVGFEIINNRARFFQDASSSKSMNINASARAGVRGEAMLRWLGIGLADANARVGVGAYASARTNSAPPPYICLDVGAYVFLRLSALERGLVSELLNLDISVDIWNRNHSPFRESWHFEDGTLVGRCTVGCCDNGGSGGAEANRIAVGNNNVGVILSDGSLWMWGSNGHGQIGNGRSQLREFTTRVMENVYSFDLGFAHSGAIQGDGSLWMWGFNNQGQLGDGTTTSRYSPVRIMENVRSISLAGNAANLSHSAAITTAGVLYLWGDNASGKLGDGTTTNRHTPIRIMDNVRSVSLGGNHSAAITNDGNLYMWGRNTDGQLGDGTTTNRHTPIRIMDNVRSVCLGNNHTAVIRGDGSLWVWGSNAHGQIGDDTLPTGGTARQLTPLRVMENIQRMSMGANHSGAIDTQGNLWTWGDNQGFQLGDDSTSQRRAPVHVMSNVESVAAGQHHTAAISTAGGVYITGQMIRYGPNPNPEWPPLWIMTTRVFTRVK